MRNTLTRVAAACAVYGMLALALTGCGTRRSASPTTPGSASAAAAPLTGPAVDKYGQAKVQAAYKQMIKFSFDTSWNPALITKHVDLVTRADFASVLTLMTPECAKTFDAVFAKVVTHDKAAIHTLEGAIFLGVEGPNGTRPVQSGKIVTERKYSQLAVGLDTSLGVERLSISFTAQANIQMIDAAGKHYLLPTSRKVRYLLIPNTDSTAANMPFLIAAWQNKMTTNHLQPVK
jgi:hypothetical protein